MGKDIIEKKDVQKFLDGDHKLNDNIYQEIIAFLLSLNRKNRVNYNNIKDIAQNALLMLLLNLKAEKFKYESSLNTYAKAIAKRQFYKFINDKSDEYLDISDPLLLEEIIEDEPQLLDINAVRYKVYNEELKKMPKSCRQLLGFVVKKISYEEIAIRMGYEKHDMVRERVYRCKIKLANSMNNNPLLIKAKNYE